MTIRMTSLRRVTAAVALTGVLGFGLAACGSDSGSETTKSPTASASETPSEKPSPTETATPDAAGDSDLAAFCQVFESMQDLNSDMTTLQSDPVAGMAALNEFSTQIKAVTPPAEVADDYTTFATAFAGYIDQVQAIVDNPTDPDALTKMTDAMGLLTDQSFTDATTNISVYAMSNCS